MDQEDKMKILIVDDKVENLIALEKILGRLDVEFVRATSGREALGYIQDHDFALALVDVNMPGMDGYETVEHIHQNQETDVLPVIFVSAVDRDDFHMVKGIEAGAVDYIVKPIIPEILLGKVKVFLKIHDQKTTLSRQKEEIENYSRYLYESVIEVKKASRELEKAMQVKSEFLSVVSHELRTPLTAIKEGIRLAADKSTGEMTELKSECLDVAQRNVDRLVRLINDVLDFQKLDAGKMHFDLDSHSINEIAKDVYRSMLPAAGSIGVDLRLELNDDLPAVEVDEDRIIQVITNLVSNSLKFIETGYVTIATCMRDKSVCVSVEDTGCGITREDMDKVFNEFEQLKHGGERKTGGTGLGLAISREIIERHGGTIWVESEQGRGTTFYFTLPVKDRASSESDR